MIAKVDFDGVHSMERARKEAEGFVRALHYFNKEENLWGKNKDITVGQIMCFMTYTMVTIVVILGELLRRVFYKPIRSIVLPDVGNDAQESISLLRMEVTYIQSSLFLMI